MSTVTRFRTFALLVACLSAIFVVGCQRKGPELYRVTGTVTRAGQPVPGMLLKFQPDNARPSQALTDERGAFVVRCTYTLDGAVPGKHKVIVSFVTRAADEHLRAPAPPHPQGKEILAKYGIDGTDPLFVDINQDGQELEIKLD